MFHVKHTCFAGLKTLILSNTACLEPSFTLRREPARYALDLAPGSDRYDKLLALAIAPQILTKETRIVFLLYRERARWSYNKTIRAHQPHSTPSSIKPRRRLHLNARASNVSYHFRHTPQPPIFLPTTNTLPQSKPPSPQKMRRMLLSDSPAKTTKTSINIAFLSPFHVKHRLKSHISTPLNPSALPHDRRHQTTRHIGQCKHASIVLPRSILRRFTIARRSLCNFALVWAHCPITRDTRQQQSLFAQCRAAAQTPH